MGNYSNFKKDRNRYPLSVPIIRKWSLNLNNRSLNWLVLTPSILGRTYPR